MWETAVHLAVDGGVYDGVFLCLFSPRDVLDGILDLIESVSEGFPTFSWLGTQYKEIETCLNKNNSKRAYQLV